MKNLVDGQTTNTCQSKASPIPIQTTCIVAIIEAIDALYLLIELSANLPACKRVCKPNPAHQPTYNGQASSSYQGACDTVDAS